MLEDVSQKVLLSLHLAQFLWFESYMSELVNIPVEAWFHHEVRNDFGTCCTHKFKSHQGWFLEWIVWPKTGGRKKVIDPGDQKK